eukprot:708665_1
MSGRETPQKSKNRLQNYEQLIAKLKWWVKLDKSAKLELFAKANFDVTSKTFNKRQKPKYINAIEGTLTNIELKNKSNAGNDRIEAYDHLRRLVSNLPIPDGGVSAFDEDVDNAAPKKKCHALTSAFDEDHDEKSEIEFQFALSNGTDYSNNAPTTDFAKNPFYESKKLACNEPIVSYRGEPFVDHDYTKPDNTYQTLPVFSFYPQRDPTIYCSGCHEYFGQKFAKIQCLRCNQVYTQSLPHIYTICQ